MRISITTKQSHSISMDGQFSDSKRLSGRLKLATKNFLMSILWLLVLMGMSVGSVSGLVTRPDSSRPKVAAVLSKKLISIGADDGWILESTETSNKGGSMNSIATTIWLGDDAKDRQYRAILSFDTSTLPANVVIKSVALKIKKQSITGTDPFKTHGNLIVDMRKGTFSNNKVLQLGDFAITPSKANAMNFAKTPVSGWYTATLGAANFRYINRIGLTQFRLRFTKDDNDDRSADIFKIYSGNAGAATRPQLIVTYDVPDTTPPAAIDVLSAIRGTSAGTVDLSWTAPGDDGNTGAATSYEVRYATSAIANDMAWDAATPASGFVPTPQAAGGSETMTVTALTPGAQFFFAVRAVDDATNRGAVSTNSPGAVAHIICGQVITENTLLATDMNCPSDTLRVLEIGASNITLDLGGHTISSTYMPPLSNSGVYISSHTGVTLRNGVIDGFYAGVDMLGSNQVTLEGLTIRNMDFNDPLNFVFGAQIVESQQVVVMDSLFEFLFLPHKEGVVIYESSVDINNIEVNGGGTGVNFSYLNNDCDPLFHPNTGVVRNSRFSNMDLNGILVACGTNVSITDNVFTLGDGNAIVGSGPDEGDVSGLTVEGNTINGGYYIGIQFGGAIDSTVSNNTVNNNHYGILMEPSYGWLHPASGFEAYLSTGNMITDNTALGNAIDLYHHVENLGNTWARNTCTTKEGAEIPPCAPPDTTAPAAINNLSAVRGTSAGTVDLSWTAPGDDGNTGTANSYEVRRAANPIVDETTWNAAVPVSGIIPTPQVAGMPETITVIGLTPGAQFFFAVRALDEALNQGAVSTNSPGAVAHIVCGQVVTENTLLATDLSCPPETAMAIIITASNLTLDLGGHTISGYTPNTGVHISSGLAGVTIRNGSIDGFNVGIYVDASNLVTLEDLTIRNMDITDPNHFLFGTAIVNSQQVVVRDALFEFPTVAHKEAVEIFGSTVDVDNIEVSGGGAGVSFSFLGDTCDPVNSPSNGTVRNSNFHDIYVAGIWIACSSNALVEDNEFTGCPECLLGIQGESQFLGAVTGFVVKNNIIHDTFLGIEFRGVSQSSILNNRVYNNRGWGIAMRQSLGCLSPQPNWECFYSTANVIADNETWGNVTDLYHYEYALGNTWEGNSCETKDGVEIPECTPPNATHTINLSKGKPGSFFTLLDNFFREWVGFLRFGGGREPSV
jgi:parallel beta-helix repeat protein